MKVTRTPAPVLIELTESEALVLRTLFGSLSRNKVSYCLNGRADTEETHNLTGAIFGQLTRLQDEGR